MEKYFKKKSAQLRSILQNKQWWHICEIKCHAHFFIICFFFFFFFAVNFFIYFYTKLLHSENVTAGGITILK